MKIKRSRFFKGLALGIISAPFAIRALSNESKAQSKQSNSNLNNERFKWSMVTTWPPKFPVLGDACQMFADIVQEMSAGRMEIRVYGGGELVPPLEAFDAVQNGAAEMANGCAYYWAGKAPAAQFFATVPFGMNAQQMNSWLINGGGWELWKELYEPFNLIPMPGGNTGVQMGGWYNREINTLDDLRGLKMRIPGLGGKVMERAGGTPVLLAGGEIYTGLERGVIDATEWLGPFHDYKMGFQDIATYYYSPGWHEPGTELEFLFNKEKFEALPPDLQMIMETAALRVNAWTLQEMETQNSKQLEVLQKEGIIPRTLSPEILSELRRITNEVVAELIADDPFAQRVFQSYENFRKRASVWAQVSEKVFHNEIQHS